MGSLTETAYYARNIIKFGAIGLVAFIIFRYSVIFGWELYKKYHPDPAPSPTMGFGYLPKIEFPSSATYSAQFELKTKDLDFPFTPDRMNVYFIPYLKASLLAYDEAQTLAINLGFAGDGKTTDSILYEWEKNISAHFTFKINIFDGSFVYSYKWQDDKDIVNNQAPGKAAAIISAANFLQDIDPDIIDLDLVSPETTYLMASGNKLKETVSLQDAEFVRVDYFRKPIMVTSTYREVGSGEYPVLTQKPNEGIISVIVSGDVQEKKIINCEYNYFPVNYYTIETYPTKKVEQAWEELRKGYGYITQNDTKGDKIMIRNISLAYFDSKLPQKYLQPIYVFEGDDNSNREFIAYIPALQDNIYEQE